MCTPASPSEDTLPGGTTPPFQNLCNIQATFVCTAKRTHACQAVALPQLLSQVRGVGRQQQHERRERGSGARRGPFGGGVHELHHGRDGRVETELLGLRRHLCRCV
jgi:hypothetical protein